jgi:hypothetical protein
MDRELQYLKTVFKVTQWRDGCVFKTEEMGDHWIDQSTLDANNVVKTNLIYAPLTNFKLKTLSNNGRSDIRAKPLH